MKNFLLIFISFVLMNGGLQAQNIEYIGNAINISMKDYKIGNIQWQFSANGQDWVDIAGKTSTNLSYNIIETGYFRAKVTYGDCDYFADSIKIEAYLNFADKKGFVTHRIDDSKNVTRNFNSVCDATLEKFNARYSYAINAAFDLENKALELQLKGHELMDHTPNHSVSYFTVPPGEEAFFSQFIGSGLDKIVDGKATVTQLFLISGTDVSKPSNPKIDLAAIKIGADNGYRITPGTNIIKGDFSTVVDNNWKYLYIDNLIGKKIGWVPVLMSSITSGSVQVTYPDKSEVIFDATENITMYSMLGIDENNITLEEDAMYVVMLAGQKWFQYLGLEPPKVWVRPGELGAKVNNKSLEAARKKIGLTYCIHVGATDLKKPTYNFEREYPRTCHFGTGLYLDYMALSDLQSVKVIIAEMVAKGLAANIVNHHSFAKDNFIGGVENYQLFIYQLYEWLYQNEIPVLTISQMASVLNDSKTNPDINIIPDLFTDKAGQNKPDGYTLGTNVIWVTDDGRPEDKNHSLKLNGNGTIFTINSLGALEKGKNYFECWIKGTDGATLTFTFGSIGSVVFKLTSSATWQKFQISDSSEKTIIDIPHNKNFLDISAVVSNNVGNDVLISGMILKGQ